MTVALIRGLFMVVPPLLSVSYERGAVACQIPKREGAGVCKTLVRGCDRPGIQRSPILAIGHDLSDRALRLDLPPLLMARVRTEVCARSQGLCFFQGHHTGAIFSSRHLVPGSPPA